MCGVCRVPSNKYYDILTLNSFTIDFLFSGGRTVLVDVIFIIYIYVSVVEDDHTR